MSIRTFFWHERVIGKNVLALYKRILPSRAATYFHSGNAGDTLAKSLLAAHYHQQVQNVSTGGRRLLCIGSTAHKIMPHDVVCGIGARSADIPEAKDTEAIVWGVRGPLSYEIFKNKGYDMRGLQFLADPGLLIRNLITDISITPQTGKILFIPHYRERFRYRNRLHKQMEVIDIDIDPVELAARILQAESVLSSSLHGLVFAHALGRPCKFVLPQSDEPLLKYTDYFESVNIHDPGPLSNVYSYTSYCRFDLPAGIDRLISTINFPGTPLLEDLGIIKT